MYDVPLALVATAFVPLLVVGVVAASPGGAAALARGDGARRQLSAHLVEDVSGVETVKAFGAERAAARKARTRLVGLVQSMFALQKLGISMSTPGDCS